MKNDAVCRSGIIEISAGLERVISRMLSILLSIDIKTSKCFGNLSSPMPLDMKINLLLDMKILSKKEKEKLKIFMEIRNQFAHNIDIKTYDDFFNRKENKNKAKNRVQKIYDTEKADFNAKQHIIFIIKDIEEITNKFTSMLENFNMKKGVIKKILDIDLMNFGDKYYTSKEIIIEKLTKNFIENYNICTSSKKSENN